MSKVDDAIAVASAELGKPYVWGAEGPGSFDCSGLMQWIFSHVGISLPRTAAQQQAATTRVASPLPGDLVFYGAPAYHVGLYIGGGKMIDAPDVGDVVKVQSVWGSPTYGRVSGLGAAAATVVAPVVGAVGLGASTLSDWLGGARNITLEFVFVGLGLGLVGFGIWRAVQRKEES